ncbi:transcription termination/antitermination factor NusG [Tessaracoccus lapidicaptus]|uniref:Transcription termination/antitermination protein NusG n=1 Tax=Tessaracoccus lapidicaptus TaxID=1427523 RepID=A0A1C0AH71_9ACTN|nr:MULTISPECIES: transcription termination/antitermination protein NusG [Tessaracoccus]AQX16536.1 transcription termination/antitermination factor NusG [Tessaracoccus sp. T2.5-30]OCL31365.1 transcription termination/antitermination factor NusG [Tessaracoccus lapidicaptus]VEP41208.1 Transcription termination/antitermination protein NusG [Tessaracoccus lapidicaptus]
MTDSENNDIEFEIDLGSLEESASDDVEIDLGDLGEDETDADAPVLLAEEEPEADESASEQDDAVDAALAELRAELESKYGEWYVIHTYSGMENRVKQNVDSRAQTLNMEDYIFETVVPTEEVVEIRNNARKTVTRCVLPGYVLVRMELTDDSWSVVRQTPSVTGFVGHGQQPVALSVDEVLKMLTPSVIAKVNQAQAGAAAARRKKVEVVDFEVGDSVMIIDGPFTGVHATITELNPNTRRLIALVEILGRETPVDLEFKQVEKVV